MNRDQQATNRDRERGRERARRERAREAQQRWRQAAQSRSKDCAGSSNSRFHTCSRLLHSLVCFILCGIVNPMAIFFLFFVLSVFLRKGESGKSSLGRKLLICIFTHGSSLSGFIILCGASNPMAMVVVFVLLFFSPPFLQIGISRPSNNPLGEKILIFIFTLGGSFSGFILCGTFTPIVILVL